MVGSLVVALVVVAVQDPPAPAPPPARAVRAAAPPRLDGRLDDAAWRDAPVLDRFIQRDPDEGAPATERTEVRIVYTDDALYVAVRAHETDPRDVVAPLGRRDAPLQSDRVGIMIDSWHDRRSAFEFMVTPAGVQSDTYWYDDGQRDATWDATWESAARRDSSGWSAELRIPFSQLRYTASPSITFGFNAWRRVSRKNEIAFLSPPTKDNSRMVSRFGELRGIDGIATARQIEISPYVVGREVRDAAEAGNPFRTGRERRAVAGADLKMGLAPGVTLTAALNPDFGQVEADPASVNLSASETFVAEQRPFFAEASDVFRFGTGPSFNPVEQLFYTRRLGRAPQGSPLDRGGYQREPRETTILGAAKVAGRTAAGWRFGLMSALTDAESADVIDATGSRYRDEVEPRTAYLVGRVARELDGGRTAIGAYATGTRRWLPERLHELRTSAVVGGIDLNQRFGRGDAWQLRLWGAGTRVAGSAEAIDSTQRSSVHYFQRPDYRAAAYDPSRTSLTGFSAQATLEKRAGDWLWLAQGTTRSPGFESNDAGYQFWAGRHIGEFALTRRWQRPGLFRTADVRLGQFGIWTYDGDRVQSVVNLSTTTTLRNYWSLSGAVWHRTGGLDPMTLRGGPALRIDGNMMVRARLETDLRRPFSASIEGFRWDYYGGASRGGEVVGSLAWRPAARAELSVAPRIVSFTDNQQYVTTAEVGGAPAYVVGELHQTMTSLRFRGDLLFTPRLSLQLYAEPFVSANRFTAFRRVLDARARDQGARFETLEESRIERDGTEVRVDLNADGLAETDLDSPDFTTTSFRANAVLRWEYRPSSTLFVVWQQDREAESGHGRYEPRAALDHLFSTAGRTAFIVKLSYWWSVR
jgi:hypothetical protein